MGTFFSICVGMVALAGLGIAQPAKWIEVASVKPSANPTAESNVDSARGRLTATSVTVRELIRLGYRVKDYQIGRMPGWVDSERFDIAAKNAGDTKSLEDEKSLVRELLTYRFQFRTHREPRQMAVYLLVVAKGGAKLAPHSDSTAKVRGGCGSLIGRRVTADGIASLLARQVEHEVVNRTGLAGEYDLQLDFTPDSGACGSENTASIFTALQEQLGLKLESSRGQVEVLMVDRVERPSAN